MYEDPCKYFNNELEHLHIQYNEQRNKGRIANNDEERIIINTNIFLVKKIFNWKFYISFENYKN